MIPLPIAATDAPTYRRDKFLVRGLRSVGFGVFIALLVTGGFGTPFWPNLVQSVCIAVLCWFTIDITRLQLARWVHRNDPPDAPESARHWPGWPLMVVAIVVGTLVGFSGGDALTNLILGRHFGGFFRGSWRQMVALLLGSLIPGTVISYWFYSRETIAGKEAAIQAAKRQAAEHQLKLLESQLEPHMLFNTLANLRVLIGVEPARAQTMLDQLIAFLRATLSGSRTARHPLQAEFARLGDYLALMQIRMGDRLRTRFDLPAALAAVPVPPLLLQPLVENCIKHGLEPAIAGGRIDVGAARDGDTLVLTVRDTGAGLASPSGDGTRFGLVQVRDRLAALYGERARLALSDAVDAEGGTLATIRLPIEPVDSAAAAAAAAAP